MGPIGAVEPGVDRERRRRDLLVGSAEGASSKSQGNMKFDFVFFGFYYSSSLNMRKARTLIRSGSATVKMGLLRLELPDFINKILS